MSHRGDLPVYLLNLPLLNQSQKPKRQLFQRRLKKLPKAKREKQILEKMPAMLQKMEMQSQIRHKKLKLLEMPSELCEF